MNFTNHNQGANYAIDSLPEGYAVFDRPRGTNPDIVSLATEDLFISELHTDRRHSVIGSSGDTRLGSTSNRQSSSFHTFYT